MEVQVAIERAEHDDMTDLLASDGRLRETVDLEEGLTLAPQFTSIKKRRALGGADILQFVLSVPFGVGTGVAANAVYTWLVRHKVPRIRIATKEIVISDDKEHVIRLIIEQLPGE